MGVDSIVNNQRPRVRLIECWYKKPVRAQYVQSKEFPQIQGEEFNEQEHGYLVPDGYISVHEGVRQQVFCAVFIHGTLLQHMRSPFKHNRFPFTPLWAYRRKRDGSPYGAIRNQRDPQTDLNKRRSKAIFILSANQIEAEAGAFVDKEEARAEAAASDGIIEYKRGYNVKIHRDNSLAQEHVMLEQEDKQYIREVAGVTGENLGMQTNATSGKAIQARQNEGSVSVTELFDNRAFCFQCRGEKILSMAEQYYTEEKVIRIVGEKGIPKLIKINENAQFNGETRILNDINSTKSDFIVNVSNYHESVRIEMFNQLFEMIGKLPPEIMIQTLDVVIDMSDIPRKDEIVARIRKINGETDPDKEDTPEAIQAKEAQAQAQAEQDQLMKAMAMAELENKRASAQKINIDAIGKQVETMQKALDVARAALIDPVAAATVDEIINQSTQEVVNHGAISE
jgi:hypothetical protein